MQTDLYTKAILTVIALALVLHLVLAATPAAEARSGVVQVDIVRVSGLDVGTAVPVRH